MHGGTDDQVRQVCNGSCSNPPHFLRGRSFARGPRGPAGPYGATYRINTKHVFGARFASFSLKTGVGMRRCQLRLGPVEDWCIPSSDIDADGAISAAEFEGVKPLFLNPALRAKAAQEHWGMSSAVSVVMSAQRWKRKGKKVSEFKPGGKAAKNVVDAMLGPTGNMRAPTIRAGKSVIVGFNEELFASKLT